MVRGPPGRGSSTKPSSRRSINRRRHTPTVCGHTPTSAATCLLGLPAAQPNTIRHRCANACDDVGRRAHRSNVARSSSVNDNSGFGLPRSAMNQVYNYRSDSWRRTLAARDDSQILRVSDTATSAPKESMGRRRRGIPVSSHAGNLMSWKVIGAAGAPAAELGVVTRKPAAPATSEIVPAKATEAFEAAGPEPAAATAATVEQAPAAIAVLDTAAT